MRRIISLLSILFLGTNPSYSQLTFDALVNSFSGFENNEFHQYLIDNDFKMISASPDSTTENWHFGYDERTQESQIILQKFTFPGNSLWIVTYGHPIYDSLIKEIKQQCEFMGYYGSLEFRAWEEYKHQSGIEFSLVQYAKEKGHFIIEVLQASSAFVNSDLIDPKNDTEHSLIESNTYHIFSLKDKLDFFSIAIYGNSIIEGTVKFTIKDYMGNEILNEEFPAKSLLGYYLDYDASIKEKEDFIRKRIADFFKEENFHDPAISEDEIFDKDYSNLKIWNDIYSDRSAIGFFYLIGEEDGRMIAFSKTLKKVVMYFNCC